MITRIILGLFAASSLAIANSSWEATLTSQKIGPHPPLASSTMEFSLSWKGMLKAGKLDIQIAPPGQTKKGSLVIKSDASSLGPAAVLYPYSHNYWAELNPTTLSSKFFQASEKTSKENTTTTNHYYSKSASTSEVTKKNKSGKIETDKKVFPYASVRDVFSALLHIRSQKLAIGEEHVLLIMPFTSAYVLTARSEAKEQHMGRDAIRLSFSMRKIDTKTNKLKAYTKIKKPVTLWLSDDADRILLEVRVAAYIGDVRAELTNFTKNP